MNITRVLPVLKEKCMVFFPLANVDLNTHNRKKSPRSHSDSKQRLATQQVLNNPYRDLNGSEETVATNMLTAKSDDVI